MNKGGTLYPVSDSRNVDSVSKLYIGRFILVSQGVKKLFAT